MNAIIYRLNSYVEKLNKRVLKLRILFSVDYVNTDKTEFMILIKRKVKRNDVGAKVYHMFFLILQLLSVHMTSWWRYYETIKTVFVCLALDADYTKSTNNSGKIFVIYWRAYLIIRYPIKKIQNTSVIALLVKPCS